MAWIIDHVSQLFQGMFWRSLLESFHWVDWFTVAFVLVGLVYGIRKGLMRELVEVLELILIIFLVYNYKEFFLGFLKSLFPSLSNRFLEPAVFILVALAFWFLVAFLDGYLQKVEHSQVTKGIKVIGGGLTGIFHFLIIWSLISQVLMLLPARSLARSYEPGSSLSGEKVLGIAPLIQGMIRNPSKPPSKTKAKIKAKA